MRKCRAFGIRLVGFLLAGSVAILPIIGASAQQERVVATVDGETITMAEVQIAFQSLPREIRSQGLGTLYPQILERMIQQRIIFKRGREAKLQDTPELKRRLKVLENQLVHDMYLARQVEERLDDETVKESYNAWLAQNPPIEEVRARHILLETEAEAKEVVQQVIAGRQFSDLARERSKGPSSIQGGDLGWLPRGRATPEFEKAAFALGPNQFTANPIRTEHGWHVILVEEKRAMPQPTFEQVRPLLIEQIGERIAFQIAAELVRNAEVQRFDMSGNPMGAPPLPAPAPAAQ